jgi:xanthine dehydrogenase accessory factor
MTVWPTIERFVTEFGGAVLVTVADAKGSSPRDAGVRMIVRPDGGFHGTIGGGTLEWIALAEAQALLSGAGKPDFKRVEKALGPDLGQCCGGWVAVTLERFGAEDISHIQTLAEAERSGPLTTVSAATAGRPVREIAAADFSSDANSAAYVRMSDGRVVERFVAAATPLYLFGAGHVGRSLALALAPLPFAVTWIDPRPNAFPPHIPANVTCIGNVDPARAIAEAPAGAFVAIMTHSHALDLDITAIALRARRFPYVGLIGSGTKRARFDSTLRKLGLAEEDIAHLVCPIGLIHIKDKSPAAIAASIVAQVLIARDNADAIKSWDASLHPMAGGGRRHG